jgi:conserved hypothetical protein, proteobacterial
MKKLKVSLLAAVGSLALAGGAHAQDEGSVSLSFNIGAASDYVFRGVSQTDEDPQVFGGVDAAFGSIGYAGVWASNVDFGDSTDFEFDLYAGITPTVGAVSFDIGINYFGYADQPSGANLDYWEGKIAASVPAGPATLGAAVFYSPEFSGKTGEAWYWEANASVPIPDSRFSVSGAIGHQTIDKAGDYTTWNLGVGFELTENIGIDVRYWDTSKHKYGDIYDSRVVAGLKFSF